MCDAAGLLNDDQSTAEVAWGRKKTGRKGLRKKHEKLYINYSDSYILKVVSDAVSTTEVVKRHMRCQEWSVEVTRPAGEYNLFRNMLWRFEEMCGAP